ncbi:protein HEATR9 isoform X1 [Acinonyx jubatus]|uniref:Protein HEATR9 isoform X1 n=2 Tax=Acinonyx jubatus TaxID=32536 RepID=A0A6J1XCD4_ACIJB|nr:protein HEATR9 isoform X1 [Acinonyx jubatus]
MAYEISADILDIATSMFKYPWLEYPERTKELRKAMAPVRLPLSRYQMPKEEFPPSPECWRQHPSKPLSVPYCYCKKPEVYTHWHTLCDKRQEREAEKMLRKMRDHPRQLKEGTPIQKFHLPMSKLTIQSQMGSKPSDPAGDPLKWQRLKVRDHGGRENGETPFVGVLTLGSHYPSALSPCLQNGGRKGKGTGLDEHLFEVLQLYLSLSSFPLAPLDGQELTKSLESPREPEQFYAAQALGCLGVSEQFVMEALWQVAQTGSEKVKSEACRSLALLGCLNKHVIQVLITQLKGQNEEERMDSLTRLRVALNSQAAVPKDKVTGRRVSNWGKRTQVGDEEKLVPVLQMLIKKSSNEAAVEAALCLGFLRPCSKIAQEFLLQCLSQGSKTQRMKALRMLVKMMHVHSATVIRAILDQLCSSSVLEHRFEATQMLKTIGLEKIQAQGLEGFTFDLLWRKTYNEPFLAMRQAVAETVEELKMKPTMMNLVEAQLMNSNATARQEAVISLGVLGIHSPQVFHLLLDMLDAEKSQAVKNSLQETLTLLASTDPWIQNKLKNKVIFVYEAPKTNEEAEPTRFRKDLENPEELNIQDFQLAQLNPLFIAKSRATSDQQKKLSAQRESAFYLTSTFPTCFSKPKHKAQATGPWVPGIRKQLQILAKTSK